MARLHPALGEGYGHPVRDEVRTSRQPLPRYCPSIIGCSLHPPPALRGCPRLRWAAARILEPERTRTKRPSRPVACRRGRRCRIDGVIRLDGRFTGYVCCRPSAGRLLRGRGTLSLVPRRCGAYVQRYRVWSRGSLAPVDMRGRTGRCRQRAFDVRSERGHYATRARRRRVRRCWESAARPSGRNRASLKIASERRVGVLTTTLERKRTTAGFDVAAPSGWWGRAPAPRRALNGGMTAGATGRTMRPPTRALLRR